MIIVLLGAPGCGKGTQGSRLARKYSVPQLSSGDILRAAIRNGTSLGKEASRFMEKGELVTNELILGMMDERMKEPDCSRGYILDGFPRTVPQAKGLDEILKKLGARIDKVFNIEVSDNEVVRRLGGRRQCTKCSAVYHVDFSPSKEESKCDKCGGALYQRGDDKEATIKNRLKIYKEETAPLIEYYKNNIVNIDGAGSADAIFDNICSLIDKI